MFTRRPPALEPRDFPLVLRREWRIDCPARLGRQRALDFLATCERTARPIPFDMRPSRARAAQAIAAE